MINLEGECVIEQDLHTVAGNVGERIGDMAAVADNPSYGGFEVMEMGDEGLVMGRDLSWVETEQENVLDMNDDSSSIFYSDVPSLPDFPCMSSSSSSSSAPPAAKAVAATSSSSSAASSSTSPAASWVVGKLVAEEETERRKKQVVEVEHAALSSTGSMEITPPPDAMVNVDYIDIMENLGYMDLIDSNELWDPSSIFQGQEFLAGDVQGAAAEQEQKIQCQEECDGLSFLQGSKELSLIFLEWLKQNKDYISAEDVRKIKLKRSTIENASKLLGSSKEGMKHLLKLILEWVEQYHLQKKGRPRSPYQFQETIQYPEFNPIFNPSPVSSDHCNACFSTSPWMPPAALSHPESSTLVAVPPCFPPPVIGYSTGGNPYSNPVPISPVYHQMVNGTMPYSMMNNAQSWTRPPFPVPSHQQTFFRNNPYQILDSKGETLLKLDSSATKEARKKRMARQKRPYLHHHRHNSNQNQMDSDSLEFDDAGEDGHQASPQGGGDWMYSPPATPFTETITMVPPLDALQPHTEDHTHMQNQNYQRQSPPDRRQQGGCKTEKNLKFLLQKVLKQSDVGNLGRIVLPKKEAEKHLPELESRDGITITMEDIGCCRVWNMRYRFWPNNKSRMYLLENTGDFVRVNGLQEGDFIVIYLDIKCGKYMIRGVKVREPRAKLDGKKPAKRNARNLS